IIRDNGGFEMEYKLYPDEMKAEDLQTLADGNSLTITTEVKDLGMMTLHIGAREGQIVDVNIPEISLEALGIDMINTNTEFGCGKAITALDGALDFVSALRSSLGAYQNRLDSTISNLSVVEENMTSAISRIEDADMAAEMTEFTKLQVLTQASTAMVAQANERPQTVLQLLQ
ncbi:MAG: flagellin FliC3, partial [Lachnospiraceae bacterium]|nr:flagellin FliC3 [Lachnospiraceae bacterium]